MRKRQQTPCLLHEDNTITHVAKKLKRKENSIYLLGFYSKKSNSLRLVQAPDTFNFERSLKSQNSSAILKKFDQDAKGMRRKEILVQELGTKKSKKIMKQLKSKVIEEDRIQSADQIKQIIKMQAGEFKDEIKELEAEKFQREWNRKKSFLPDFNLSAKSAAKIYNLRSIISEEDDFILNPEKIDIDRVNYYVVNLMDAFVFDEMDGETEDDTKKKLLYLNYLIKMKKLRKIEKPLEEISQNLEIPVVIVKSIVHKFFEPIQIKDRTTGVNRGIKWFRNRALDIKLVCYIFILNLILMKFKINLKPLMKVLKLDESV